MGKEVHFVLSRFGPFGAGEDFKAIGLATATTAGEDGHGVGFVAGEVE